MCSATGFEYWSGCDSSTTFDLMPVSCSHSGPGEVARVERLQPGLVGHVERDAVEFLGGLHGAIGRAVRRAFGRGLQRRGLRLAERRRRIGELDLRPAPAPIRSARGQQPRRTSASMPVIWPNRLMKSRRVGSPRSQASTSAGEAGFEITSFAIVHVLLLPCCRLLVVVRHLAGAPSRALCQSRLPPSSDVTRPSAATQPSRRLFAEARAEIRQSRFQTCVRQHVAVDDAARLAAVLDVEHRLDVGRAVAGEALVGPAQRVRREDDVVERAGSDRRRPAAPVSSTSSAGAGDAAAPAAPRSAPSGRRSARAPC